MTAALSLVFLLAGQVPAHEGHEPPDLPQHEGHQGTEAGHVPNVDPMAMMEEMEATDRWMTMIHGYAFLSFNRQGGPSGDRDFESQNHLMVMSTHRWAGGKLSLRGTFTAEPATIAPEGSPELFQRGETYNEVLLVDRQHPHDLFVQLAAQWERPLSDRTAFKIYVSPWGEPAVGPTAYPHRLSASANPLAPLAHHNQDSTHISANVITAGLRTGRVSFEASAFHGAEPDERRWDIDGGPIDSYAGRVTYRPLPGLSMQLSAARRTMPEPLEEGDQTRQTLSVEYFRATSSGFITAALILGRNILRDTGSEWGSGMEATWRFLESNSLYGRIESVDRDLFELTNKQQRPEAIEPAETTVQAATMGYLRDLPFGRQAGLAAGAGVTFYRFDSELEPVYGEFPVSAQLFMRVRFGWHSGRKN